MVQRIAALIVAMLIPVSARGQASPAPDGLKREALPSVYVLDDRGVERFNAELVGRPQTIKGKNPITRRRAARPR